jgi:hypothetical protein
MKVIRNNGHKSLVIEYDDNLKNHLRIFDDEDKQLIIGYIRAAGDYIEKYIGRPILTNSLTVIGNAKDHWFELPKETEAVLTIQERKTDGTWLELTPETDQLDSYGVYSMYYDEALNDGMEYKMDVLVSCEISNLVKQAAYLIVAEMYEQRENRSVNTTVFSRSADTLLDKESLLL